MRILIVGAGPIGCYTARLLKERDSSLDITIIEEHAQIGRPVHCAGLVSRDTFQEARVHLDGNSILNHIDGAEFFLEGDSFRINRKDVALVINRQEFDCELGNGLKVELNTKFVGIEKESGGYLIETDKGEYYADIVIGADGANSTLRKAAGFKENIEYLRGVQYRIKYNPGSRAFVQVFLKSQFFGWIIPESDTVVRAGIISQSPYRDLTELLKELSIEGEILEKFAGIVPLGRCSAQKGNLFLVGDAACQVKPLTHGGIYYGMRCAEILVDCIIKRKFKDYEKLWQKKFLREIEVGLRFRRLYEGLSKNNLAKLFALLKRNKGLLEKAGDFENHSKIIFALVKNTHLPSLFGDILLNIFKG